MCDTNNEVFDQIHNIAGYLFSELNGDMTVEKVKKLRHGLNLIISLSGFMDNVVTQEELALLGMGGHGNHHPDDHEHTHSDGHGHSHKHHHSDGHSHAHTHDHSDKHEHSDKHGHSDKHKHAHEH
jgi:hypothetical protein